MDEPDSLPERIMPFVGEVQVAIHKINADGSMVTSLWLVPEEVGEELRKGLGKPHGEMVTQIDENVVNAVDNMTKGAVII